MTFKPIIAVSITFLLLSEGANAATKQEMILKFNQTLSGEIDSHIAETLKNAKNGHLSGFKIKMGSYRKQSKKPVNTAMLEAVANMVSPSSQMFVVNSDAQNLQACHDQLKIANGALAPATTVFLQCMNGLNATAKANKAQYTSDCFDANADYDAAKKCVKSKIAAFISSHSGPCTSGLNTAVSTITKLSNECSSLSKQVVNTCDKANAAMASDSTYVPATSKAIVQMQTEITKLQQTIADATKQLQIAKTDLANNLTTFNANGCTAIINQEGQAEAVAQQNQDNMNALMFQ